MLQVKMTSFTLGSLSSRKIYWIESYITMITFPCLFLSIFKIVTVANVLRKH